MSNPVSDNDDHDICILVEGPAWGDAEFYGRWLLIVAKANQLFKDAKRDDAAFRAAIDGLKDCLDLGVMAMVFLCQFIDNATFTIEVGSSELNEFALMVEMGFFSLTGDRYQMTVPKNLDFKRVKQAHLRLAATEEKDSIHPERLVVGMMRSRATKYTALLGNMNEDQRLADRQALLFID